MAKVEIITIGDEILIGQIVDTNSAWMAEQLNMAGFEIAQMTSVRDDADHIVESLNMALKRVDIVLFTGGIGPTKDDITKLTLSKYFDSKLVFDQSVMDNIERIFNHLLYRMNDLTRSQAMVPDKCQVIQNKMGTAPITWFEQDGKVVVSMPGVPHEMKNAMSVDIIPRLKAKFQSSVIVHQNVLVHGYPESALAIKIEDWENSLPSHIRLAYLPNGRIVKLRLTGVGSDAEALKSAVEEKIQSLKTILGDSIVAFEDIPLEKIIFEKLNSSHTTLAAAESCSGGNIAHVITLLPGSSAVFKGSVVAYANEVKVNVLGVDSKVLEECGAVSAEVVEQMAQGVRKLMNVDYAIATSGIAGPGGGTDEKPVGSVWISVCSSESVRTKLYNFTSTREQNIERTTQEALVLLKEIM
jgi:nicotinamide-nucleotide amidase